VEGNSLCSLPAAAVDIAAVTDNSDIARVDTLVAVH
jgi:hypothetical protein